MQLRPSMRRAAKMRLALAGASGSGKPTPRSSSLTA